MLIKKYYTIKEVTKILNIFPHQLRYVEKIIARFVVKTVKGRRYYTNQNIEDLRKYYKKTNETMDNSEFIERIDDLINNFQTLAIKLKSF